MQWNIMNLIDANCSNVRKTWFFLFEFHAKNSYSKFPGKAGRCFRKVNHAREICLDKGMLCKLLVGQASTQ